MKHLIIILLAFITLGVQAQKKDRIINNKITPDSISTQKLHLNSLVCSLTDNDPTQEELAACAGSATTAGTIRNVIDNTSFETYLIISNGTNWGDTKMTIP
jgi:hypothetical protein